MRYVWVGENLIDVRQVEGRGILWVWFEVRDGDCK